MNDPLFTGQRSIKASDSDLINALQRVSDLNYFELPLLTHHRDPEGRDYLDYWCDAVGDKERRLIFRIEAEDLNLHLTGRKSLREPILNPVDGFHFMVDQVPGERVTEDMIGRVLPSTLDEDYVPDPDSFHDPRDAKDCAGDNSMKGALIIMSQPAWGILLRDYGYRVEGGVLIETGIRGYTRDRVVTRVRDEMDACTFLCPIIHDDEFTDRLVKLQTPVDGH